MTGAQSAMQMQIASSGVTASGSLALGVCAGGRMVNAAGSPIPAGSLSTIAGGFFAGSVVLMLSCLSVNLTLRQIR